MQKEVAGSHVQVQGDASASEARGSKELPTLILSFAGSFFTTDSLASTDNASCSVYLNVHTGHYLVIKA